MRTASIFATAKNARADIAAVVVCVPARAREIGNPPTERQLLFPAHTRVEYIKISLDIAQRKRAPQTVYVTLNTGEFQMHN